MQFSIYKRVYKTLLVLLFLLLVPFSSIAQFNTYHQPKLVVNISVPGMRYDYLLKFNKLLNDKGLKKMISEGAYCQRAIIDYMGTYTATGLATIATGAEPASHGVIGDHWYNYTTGEKVSLTHDPEMMTVGSDELDAQVSPRSMVASTIGDCIKGISPSSKVISIAVTPNSAVVAGGFNADQTYWISPREGNMVTSTYYASQLPSWVDEFNAKKLAEAYSSQKWLISKDAKLYYNVLRTDISKESAKIDFESLTRKKYEYQRLVTTPAAATLIKDFAVQSVIMQKLGKNDATDYLSVVFDSPLLTAQKYGTQSMELEDVIYRLDDEIASLLAFLEENVGKDNLLVVFSSPHGVSDAIMESSRIPSDKFSASQFSVLMNGFLGAQLVGQISDETAEKIKDDGQWVLDFSNNQLYLNRRKIFNAGLKISDVQDIVSQFAIQFRGVAEAITSHTMQSSQFTQGTMGMAQRSFFARHSGDVVLNLLPGWIVESQSLSDSGSPYIYDTHVPLIFWGGAVKNCVVSRDVRIEDIAPTIAQIAGVTPPNASTGDPIYEIFR